MYQHRYLLDHVCRPHISTHFQTRAQDPQFNLLYKFMKYTKLGNEYLTGLYIDGITLFAPNNAGAWEGGEVWRIEHGIGL